jgi:hypothetical protein
MFVLKQIFDFYITVLEFAMMRPTIGCKMNRPLPAATGTHMRPSLDSRQDARIGLTGEKVANNKRYFYASKQHTHTQGVMQLCPKVVKHPVFEIA